MCIKHAITVKQYLLPIFQFGFDIVNIQRQSFNNKPHNYLFGFCTLFSFNDASFEKISASKQ